MTSHPCNKYKQITLPYLLGVNSLSFHCLAPTKPPTNFTCHVLSSIKVLCEWQEIPPDSVNGYLLDYIIKYKIYNQDPNDLLLNQANSWYSFNLSMSSRRTIITNLTKFTRYQFQIHGYTGGGEGKAAWDQVKTEEDGENIMLLLRQSMARFF